MKPKVVMHNTISIDGSIKGFQTDIGLHYQIVNDHNPAVMFVGAITAKTGVTKFLPQIPEEKEEEKKKPEYPAGDPRPRWAIPDEKGLLKGMLHIYRSSEHCRDPIIFVTEKTPKDYIEYLKERAYDFYELSDKTNEFVDYKKAFETLAEKHEVKTIITDTGGTLSSVLLDLGLVDEISLLIAPAIVGKKSVNLFRDFKSGLPIETLEIIKNDIFDDGHVHLLYTVKKQQTLS